MPKYSWPEYPQPFESGFESKAYTALRAWRNNCYDMDNRVGDIEGFLTDCSDFQPGSGTFNSLVSNALLQGGVMAREYWVDGNIGSDTNPGTSSAPFKTIKKAIDSVPVGGKGLIRIAGGQTYTLTENILLYNKYIVLVKEGTDKPVVTADQYTSGGYGYLYCFNVANSAVASHSIHYVIPQNNTGTSLSYHGLGLFRSDVEAGNCSLYFYYCNVGLNDNAGYVLFNHNRYGASPAFAELTLFTCTVSINKSNAFLVWLNNNSLAYSVVSSTIQDNAGSGKNWQDLVSGVLRDSNGRPMNILSNLNFAT